MVVTPLSLIQLALAIVLIILILLQKTNTDASGALSSDGGGTHFSLQKRGGEKVLHQLTILTALLFVASVVTHIFVG